MTSGFLVSNIKKNTIIMRFTTPNKNIPLIWTISIITCTNNKKSYKITSTLVFPGTQTGADNNRRIHVSISLTSCITTLETPSCGRPVITLHTVSLQVKKRKLHQFFKTMHFGQFIVCSLYLISLPSILFGYKINRQFSLITFFLTLLNRK